jgi:3-hydroxyisobutyrate dehydrogenase
MKIGFIGLGNVGGKLAESLFKNQFDLTVHDLDDAVADNFRTKGIKIAKSVGDLTREVDVIITCLPSTKACEDVMISENGILKNISKDKIWIEMSTTDQKEVIRLGKLVKEKKAIPIEAPVSGGCHRAATGNIAIFVGGERKAFEKILPILTCMGKKILHIGELGSASILKVITNYLASVHLAALGEAWTIAKKHKLDLKKTYEGIKISSGNSFVHETESQVILNGSYNINFTMDLVEKDMALFNKLSKDQDIELEIAPFVLDIFKDAKEKFGSRAWSSMVVKRLEDKYDIEFREKGFPEELVDNEPEEKGHEV